MLPIRIVAIPTEVAEAVRANLHAPVYGFPAHVEIATDDAPCRHCLRTFVVRKDRRILFTYDRFTGVESLPQPGPVCIHADACDRYSEAAGFSRGASRKSSNARGLRKRPALAGARDCPGRQIRAGHRETPCHSRRELSSSEEYDRRLFHFSRQARVRKRQRVILSRGLASRGIGDRFFFPVQANARRRLEHNLGAL